MTEQERRQARLENWLRNLYSDAEREMREKWDVYMERQQNRAEKLLQAVRDAKTPEEKRDAEAKYRAAMIRATSGNARYKKIVDELARQYAEAGVQAAKMINHECVMSYVDGYNLSAEGINSAAVARDIGIRFEMIDQNTVAHLGEHAEDLLLPTREHPEKLDLTVWNVHNINAQVTQGIVQGEGPDKIAARLENVTKMNTVASIRTARTMITGSRNAGHMQNMKVAEDWGVQNLKVWHCHHDSRTRDSHWKLDGVAIPVDETFSNGCRYPGDPNGPAAETYNCRCGLHEKVTGFSSNLPKGKENAVKVWVDGKRVK